MALPRQVIPDAPSPGSTSGSSWIDRFAPITGSPAPAASKVYLPPSQKKAATKTAAEKTVTTQKTTASKTSSRAPAKVTTSSGGGGGGGGGVKKTADSEQVKALEELLSAGFAKARDQRLQNIEASHKQGDQILLDGYNLRAEMLGEQRLDNEIAEQNASWQNLANRAREAGDVLMELAGQGAGETDQLQAQLIAARNWAENQSEVNRAFQDSLGSNNAAIVDLNADTASARYNLANQMLNDKEQAWATYQNQMSDTSTQLGNVLGNPFSDSYKKDGSAEAWKRMASTASEAWKNPGVGDDILKWKGQAQKRREDLNNAILVGDRSNEQAAKRPEGATVVKPKMPKTWKGEGAPADEQGQPQGSNGKGTTGNNGNGKGKLQGW